MKTLRQKNINNISHDKNKPKNKIFNLGVAKLPTEIF